MTSAITANVTVIGGVADADPQQPLAGGHADVHDGGLRVLGGVGQRFGDDVVGGELDRLRQPFLDAEVEACRARRRTAAVNSQVGLAHRMSSVYVTRLRDAATARRCSAIAACSFELATAIQASTWLSCATCRAHSASCRLVGNGNGGWLGRPEGTQLRCCKCHICVRPGRKVLNLAVSKLGSINRASEPST
jgi:hypothetical protein